MYSSRLGKWNVLEYDDRGRLLRKIKSGSGEDRYPENAGILACSSDGRRLGVVVTTVVGQENGNSNSNNVLRILDTNSVGGIGSVVTKL